MIVSDFFLFAVFAALFFFESVLLSGSGTVIIYSHLLRTWEFAISGTFPFFGGRHLSLKTLTPPLGAAFITGSNPVIVSAAGFMLNPQEGKYRASGKNFYTYSEVKTIGISGSALLINDKHFCKMHCDTEAKWWKEKLIMLVNSASEERSVLIEELVGSMFDVERVEEITGSIFREVKSLRIAVNILYVFLFMAAPLLILFFSFENVLIPALLIILLMHSVAVYLFCKAYRKVFKERGFPWQAIISIAFFPPALLRSIDYFFKDSIMQFNTSAAAIILLSPEDSKKIISYLVREYTYFKFESAESVERELFGSYRLAMLKEIRSLLEKTAINYEELFIPPAAYDDLELYCPRCFCQYISNIKICEDCSIDLKKY